MEAFVTHECRDDHAVLAHSTSHCTLLLGGRRARSFWLTVPAPVMQASATDGATLVARVMFSTQRPSPQLQVPRLMLTTAGLMTALPNSSACSSK